MATKQNVLITILVLVIVVLAAILLFTLLVKPAISSYVIGKQIDAQNVLLTSLVVQAAQCQPVTLPYGNQTITLVATHCLQGQQALQQ